MTNKDTLIYELGDFSPLIFNDEKVTEHLNKVFDETLTSNLIPPVDNTHIGIEVEVERVSLASGDFSTPLRPTWQIVADGSLRNSGIEFVSLPIRGNNIYKALYLLRTTLEKFSPKYEFSERTSIHIHVNARHLTLEQLFCMLITYMIVERSLFRFVETSGFSRDKNIFCAPIQDSKWFLDLSLLISHWEKGNYDKFWSSLLRNWKKYTSMNVIPLSKQGTLEFRHMGGTLDLELLMNWINILLSLKKFVRKTPLIKVMGYVENLNTNSNYAAFMEEIFGPLSSVFNEPLFSSRIEEGVTQIKECIVSARKPKDEIFTLDQIKESSAMAFFLRGGFEFGLSDLKFLLKQRDELSSQYNRLEKEIASDKDPNTKKRNKANLRTIYNNLIEIHNKIDLISQQQGE